MASVHVVSVAPFTVDAENNRIDKNDPTVQINVLKNTRIEHLIIPDSQIPNSSGYPTIKEYLELEAVSGYELRHLDQSFVITYEV